MSDPTPISTTPTPISTTMFYLIQNPGNKRVLAPKGPSQTMGVALEEVPVDPPPTEDDQKGPDFMSKDARLWYLAQKVDSNELSFSYYYLLTNRFSGLTLCLDANNNPIQDAAGNSPVTITDAASLKTKLPNYVLIPASNSGPGVPMDTGNLYKIQGPQESGTQEIFDSVEYGLKVASELTKLIPEVGEAVSAVISVVNETIRFFSDQPTMGDILADMFNAMLEQIDHIVAEDVKNALDDNTIDETISGLKDIKKRLHNEWTANTEPLTPYLKAGDADAIQLYSEEYYSKSSNSIVNIQEEYQKTMARLWQGEEIDLKLRAFNVVIAAMGEHLGMVRQQATISTYYKSTHFSAGDWNSLKEFATGYSSYIKQYWPKVQQRRTLYFQSICTLVPNVSKKWDQLNKDGSFIDSLKNAKQIASKPNIAENDDSWAELNPYIQKIRSLSGVELRESEEYWDKMISRLAFGPFANPIPAAWMNDTYYINYHGDVDFLYRYKCSWQDIYGVDSPNLSNPTENYKSDVSAWIDYLYPKASTGDYKNTYLEYIHNNYFLRDHDRARGWDAPKYGPEWKKLDWGSYQNHLDNVLAIDYGRPDDIAAHFDNLASDAEIWTNILKETGDDTLTVTSISHEDTSQFPIFLGEQPMPAAELVGAEQETAKFGIRAVLLRPQNGQLPTVKDVIFNKYWLFVENDSTAWNTVQDEVQAAEQDGDILVLRFTIIGAWPNNILPPSEVQAWLANAGANQEALSKWGIAPMLNSYILIGIVGQDRGQDVYDKNGETVTLIVNVASDETGLTIRQKKILTQ